jgi:formylglycine-generating enzyme
MQRRASPAPTENMVWLDGGQFLMGSNDFYEEERPVRQVSVEGFWVDRNPVTVADFRRFVKATGHVTVAERAPDPDEYPDAPPGLLVPGSLVFKPSTGPVDLSDFHNWWAYVPGANWRHPGGPDSMLYGMEHHPVTHVAYEDAVAYADWAGKSLPKEAEWEFAARGGLEGAVFAWGDEFAPEGRMMANTWQGLFPWQNLMLDNYAGTSPVGSFPSNGYGLDDVTGNVWEWTTQSFSTHDHSEMACCAPGTGDGRRPRKVIKGGSHLCAPNYCLRYRPPARQSEEIDTSTSHIGFRCIVRPERDQ